MNLRRIALKYMGWCPGIDAASRFQPGAVLETPSIPHFGVISMLAILLFGSLMFFPQIIYATSIIKLGYSESLTNEAIWSIFSFIIMSSSLVLTHRWFRPTTVNKFEVNMKNLTTLLFATYSLSLIWINSYFLVFYTPYYTPLRFLNSAYLSRYLHTFILILKIASGFILLKLSSNIFRKPVLNEGNTKLASIALGLLSLAGLTSALQGIIDPGPYPTDFWITMFLPVVTLIIPCAAIGLLAYDIFMHKRVREQIGSAVLYIGLASILFEDIYWIIRRIGQGTDIKSLLPYLYVGGAKMTNTLDFPAPTLLAVVAIIFGIVLHRSGLGTSIRLKAIYSIAIISSGLANIYEVRALPIYLKYYLRDIMNLISFEALSLVSKLTTYAIWLCLIRIFEGIIILALGALCLREPAITIYEGRTPRGEWD